MAFFHFFASLALGVRSHFLQKQFMKTDFNIELRDINSITPYDRNPRLNDHAVNAVAASLQEFGFRQPIVVDENYIIIAGHTRWKAAKKLGLKKVPVHVAVDLSPEQVRAYRITDTETYKPPEGGGFLRRLKARLSFKYCHLP